MMMRRVIDGGDDDNDGGGCDWAGQCCGLIFLFSLRGRPEIWPESSELAKHCHQLQIPLRVIIIRIAVIWVMKVVNFMMI